MIWKTNIIISRIPAVVFFLLILVISAISFDFLFAIFDGFSPSTDFVGILGWAGCISAIFALGRKNIRHIVFLFIVFFLIGFYTGPFLEPPSDPINHLHRTHQINNQSIKELYQKDTRFGLNLGIWHYSMMSCILHSSDREETPGKILRDIHILHGLFLGLIVCSLFLLGKFTGLPNRWAVFSCFTAILFFGTNLFSFFRYYSFGPTFTSIMIFWLWTGRFFFSDDQKSIWTGMLSGFLLFPILLVNHSQEAAFLAIAMTLWILTAISHSDAFQKMPMRLFFLMATLVVFFLLPQFTLIQKIVAGMVDFNWWPSNQNMLLTYHDFFFGIKPWIDRIPETAGIAGITPIFCFLIIRFIRKNTDSRVTIRLLVLGVLPFIACLVPMIALFWLTVTYQDSVYRMCYISFFWLSIAYCLFACESRIQNKNFFFALCLTFLFLIAGVRTSPVYGKLDFFLLDTNNWLKEWKPLIEEAYLKKNEQKIFSDPLTSSALLGVFDIPVQFAGKKITSVNFREFERNTTVDIEKMILMNKKGEFHCVVNLHGFQPTWVPTETGHWQSELSDTARYYTYKGLTGNSLQKYLQKHPPANCKVFH
ncbi:MAG: hypothetical protein C4522_22250 [Desulfobacteraceae bacterium]|nr:MAG: hypothetical protein C4522_22250 [Desulfobacteraceae bacterium]